MSVSIQSEHALIFSLKFFWPFPVSDTSFSPSFLEFQIKKIADYLFLLCSPQLGISDLRINTALLWPSLSRVPDNDLCPAALKPTTKEQRGFQWAGLPVPGGYNGQVQEAELQATLNVHQLSIKMLLKPLSSAVFIQKKNAAIRCCCAFW